MKNHTDVKFQIAVFSECDAPVELPPTSQRIEWLRCHRTRPSLLEFQLKESIVAEIDFHKPRLTLPYLIAIIVVGEPEALRALQDQWTDSFPAVDFDFQCITEFDPAALMTAAITLLASRLLRHQSFSGRSAMDLAVYRREFERLQHNFSRLEEFVGRYSLTAPLVLFEYPPLSGRTPASAAAANVPQGTRGIERVHQLLPTDSLGVSGIAMGIRIKPAPDTVLDVTLQALERVQPLGRWSIPATDVPSGWLHLTLTHAIDEPALSLVVVIDLPGALDEFALAFGQPHPYEEFCARPEGGAPFQAPLALRVYAGLPGVRVPHVTGAYLPIGGLRPPFTLVAREICATVYQVFPPPDGERSGLVNYDDGLGSIIVHPHGRGAVTVGRLDLDAPVEAWCLSARISLEHELASPTEFALLVSARVARGLDTSVVDKVDESSPGFSGWINLVALERKRISAFIPKLPKSALTVYLLTRQAPESSPDFGWARFSGIEFNTGSRSPVGRSGGPSFDRFQTADAAFPPPSPGNDSMARDAPANDALAGEYAVTDVREAQPDVAER